MTKIKFSISILLFITNGAIALSLAPATVKAFNDCLERIKNSLDKSGAGWGESISTNLHSWLSPSCSGYLGAGGY